VDRLVHSSNHFYNREQVEAAKLISETAFQGKTLFVNSGTEANEAAIKLARKYGQNTAPEKFEIISFEGSFHGRTFGAMSATAQEKIRSGFGPIVPGFRYLPFNDAAYLEKAFGPEGRVCAVITELIQGEGGINVADKAFVRRCAELCREHRALFIIDEIQTGIGRTGRAFAFQHYGIRPDIITMAKGLGGGLPIGALHARDEISKYFEKGVHGTTFGGNHMACAAAAGVLGEIRKASFLKNIEKTGAYIRSRCEALRDKVPFIKEVRGMGLHIGIELSVPGAPMVRKALGLGLIINCTSENVLRIMPPLIINMKTVKEGLAILETILLQEDTP
jgi:acetylornithine/succinyldiaminopimelate/putrescine aminotransferase